MEDTPESPDMNPIENLGHELKEFLRCEIKPTTKDQMAFINFGPLSMLPSVVNTSDTKKVIEVHGNATGY